MAVALLLALLAGPVEEAADAVLRPGADLAALANAETPDAWLVADELCARGRCDAALAFARAAAGVDAERLPAYLLAYRDSDGDRHDRERLRAAQRAEDGGEAGEVGRLLAGGPPGGSVASICVAAARAQVLFAEGRYGEAGAEFARVVSAAERIGWLRAEAGARRNGAKCLDRAGEYPASIAAWKGAIDLNRRRGAREALAEALAEAAMLEDELGASAAALERLAEAEAIYRELGRQRKLGLVIGARGGALFHLGEYAAARACLDEALSVFREIGDERGYAMTLGNRANVEWGLGNYTRAIEMQREVLARLEAADDPWGVATALSNLGQLHEMLGEYAAAFDFVERAAARYEALSDRSGVLATTIHLASLQIRVRDPRRALAVLARAKELAELIEDRISLCTVLSHLGNAHALLGDEPAAARYYEQAYDLAVAIGDRTAAAAQLGCLGLSASRRGDLPATLALHRRALALSEESGDRAGIASALSSIGLAEARLGDVDAGLATLARAVSLARESGALDHEAHALADRAAVLLHAGRYRGAIAAAREALGPVERLLRGLAEEEGARARDAWTRVFGTGVHAALEAGDAAEVAFFLESRRAGALLASLARADQLRAATVPAALLDAEAHARGREAAARATLASALASGERQAIAAARKDLDAARGALEDAVARIQRGVKGATRLIYPTADSLDAIRGRVREGEALLIHGCLPERSVALLVTAAGTQIIRQPGEEEAAPAPPVTLPQGTRRLFVVPDGPLHDHAFCLDYPECEIAYLPSATAYGVLLDEAAPRGEGVLALGDPDGTLAASAAEAVAIGDRVFLGAEATRAHLLEGLRTRRRALHLACHGAVDAGRPLQTRLLLADAPLTVLDVYRARVPCDLVVLSACESARGRVHDAEGVMGFVRAFLTAGAPRVIVSLWKVDDDATKSLMVRFYEEWRGGAGAAAALRAAQRHVASQPKWSDPKYWAAWQLWGLAE